MKTSEEKIKRYMNKFLEVFPKIKEEEADFIQEIILWDDEKQSGFLLAKRNFTEWKDNERKEKHN